MTVIKAFRVVAVHAAVAAMDDVNINPGACLAET
jgi:hypothetical protein